jgi:hypothetical protein
MKQNDRYCGTLLISASTNEADVAYWYENIALLSVVLEKLEKFRILLNLGA